MTEAPTVYLYAIVRSPEPPELGAVPAGLPGASAPRVEPAGGGLWLAVSEVAGDEWRPSAIESHLDDLSWVSDRALAHERVVEHLAARLPVVPMKLFTLFSGVERAVASVAGRHGELGRVFDRIAGRTEWGVRVHLETERARRQAEEEMAGTGPPASGRDFLLRKKRRRDAVADVAGSARERVEALAGELSALAAGAVLKPAPPAEAGAAGASLLLDAAFLVADGERGRFEEAVRRGSEELARLACQVTLTGPWPPYHFVGTEGGA